MKTAAMLLSLALSAACASAPPNKAVPAAGARTAYDAPPAASHGIDVRIDARAAREILESLSRQKHDPQDARLLEDLPAVRLAIQDSTRSNDVFERDFAAAFEEKAGPSVFDFRTIRQERNRWQVLLDAIVSRERDLVRLASRRAAALLPGDRTVNARVRVFFTFGLAGLADHLVLPSTEGEDRMVVDVARALGEAQGEPLDSQVSRLARLVGGEAFRQAWAIYRRDNPAWGRPQPQTPPIDLLMKAVAEAGPAAVFSVEESFFPLSVWLKDPMKRSIDELNRRAERFAQAQDNLEARVELTTELRRPEFLRQLAGPAGAFLTDAIIQTSGLEALRTALQNGPKAYFQAYDRACQTDRSLIPLSQVLRNRLK